MMVFNDPRVQTLAGARARIPASHAFERARERCGGARKNIFRRYRVPSRVVGARVARRSADDARV